MRLRGKKALITGAASGIGRAIAARFIAEGADVALLDINAKQLDATVRELDNQTTAVVGIDVDLGVPSAAEKAAQAAISALKGLDILVNNAGVNASGTVATTDLASWDRTLAVDLTSVFILCKAAWPTFESQRRGAIVNMSSIMGLTGAANSFA